MSAGFRDNFRWAFSWGRWYAILFSAWVLVLSAVRASVLWPEYGTTTWGIIAGYWIAAVLGSFVVGLLRPLTGSRFGAFIVGWIGGTIVYGSVGVATGLQRDAPWWLATIPGCLVGGGLAVVWRDQANYGRNATTNWRFVAIIVSIALIVLMAMKAAHWW